MIRMNEPKFVVFLNLAGPQAFSTLSSEEKLEILRTIFLNKLDQSNFWDIYKMVKKLRVL